MLTCTLLDQENRLGHGLAATVAAVRRRLPKWISDEVQTPDSFEQAMSAVRAFFAADERQTLAALDDKVRPVEQDVMAIGQLKIFQS